MAIYITRHTRVVLAQRALVLLALVFSSSAMACKDSQPFVPRREPPPPITISGAADNDATMGSLSELARHVAAGLQDARLRGEIVRAMKDSIDNPMGLDLTQCETGSLAGKVLFAGELRGGREASTLCDVLKGSKGALLYMDRERLMKWDSTTIPIVTAIANPDARLAKSFHGYRSPDLTVDVPSDGSLGGPDSRDRASDRSAARPTPGSHALCIRGRNRAGLARACHACPGGALMRTSTAAAFVNYQKTREFEKGPARPFAVLQDVFGLRGRSICIGVAALTLVGATSSPARAQSSITPYLRSIVSHYAPILIAETDSFSSNPEAVDHILPVDFDNDPYGYNNADHANSGLVINGKSTAYYSIVETGTTTEKGYFFVNFYFYHARDAGVHFSSPFGEKTGGSHDHDLEGVMLIVRKAFGAPYGVLIGAYSEAHGALIPYANPAASIQIPNAAGGNFRGMIQFWNEVVFNVDRPVVAIRSRKHGTYMAQDCSGQSPVYDLAGGRLFGMWKGSPQTMHK